MNKRRSKIQIGTSGFSYPDWVDIFYPPDLSREQWLDYYSKHFGFCELNFSYYRMPQEKQMEKFLDHQLEYVIKAHRSLTHDRLEAKTAREDFLRAVSILKDGNKLVAVLLQFPFSFKYSPENRRYLLELLEDLSALDLIVEFRNPAWVKDSVFTELSRRKWGISMLDSPDIEGGMPQFDAVTSDIAYLRFHGRNKDNWWNGDNVSRYDYLYSQEELEAWIPRIQAMAKQAKISYISFNNHARGQAIKNANQLKKILGPSM
ncbi:MAG: DUF72 domain-containing protein [Candidatus Marinimicrobia bacterium]|nr:DUF72 domain-containing protein [Candidatus Neomarinimicrobiota bacterium]MCF7850090.1 DUF72 domain-containing protein [Candidatus Neomarinimicrobiota bacterium]MCF7904849.1 DUF72 domain-containing protein [Candidatus Neomarinimicrobiota bacterium]